MRTGSARGRGAGLSGSKWTVAPSLCSSSEMATKTAVTAANVAVDVARQELSKFWAARLDGDGQFEFTFGNPMESAGSLFCFFAHF